MVTQNKNRLIGQKKKKNSYKGNYHTFNFLV